MLCYLVFSTMFILFQSVSIPLSISRLKRLSCCRNFLDSIPSEIFRNTHIQSIDFSKNKLKYLPPDESNDDFQQKSSTSWYDDYDQHWACTNLIILKLSDNQLVKLPTAIHGATKLEKMAVSNNELISFVSPWNCPMVSQVFVAFASVVLSGSLRGCRARDQRLKTMIQGAMVYSISCHLRSNQISNTKLYLIFWISFLVQSVYRFLLVV